MIREGSPKLSVLLDSKARSQTSALLGVLVIWMGTVGPLEARLSPAMASSCAVDTVGLNPAWATGHDGPLLGEALGQVFSARDTLIQAVTVWRWAAQDSNLAGWHLWIARADSAGRPIPGSVILNGPTLPGRVGDGLTPTPFRFDFDPPFSLPGPGNYELAIQDDPCFGTIQILLNSYNGYPGGEVWLHSRSLDCLLRDYPSEFPGLDLIFQIEFCSSSTPVRPTTWGEVKAVYR
jgi:hypothetical protein